MKSIRPEFRLHVWLTVQSLMLAAGIVAHGGETMLIDHATSLANGGFEESPASQTYVECPSWDSFFPEGDSAVSLLNVAPLFGARHALVTGYQGAGARVHPSQTIPGGTWTVQEGDVFVIRFHARSWTGFDPGTDKAQVIYHIVDAAGNLVSDSVAGEAGTADRLMSRDFSIPAADTWYEHTASSNPVRAGSPWIGKRLKFRILHTGDRNEFLTIDGVSLSALRGTSSQAAQLVAAYPLDGNLEDSSGNGNHGTGTAEFGPGFGNGSSLAGGPQQSVSVPQRTSGGFSIAFWLKTTARGGSGVRLNWDEGSALVDAGGSSSGFGISLRENFIAFGTGNKSLFSRTAVNDGEWHHVAVTRAFPSGLIELRVDGLFEDTATGISGLIGGTSPVALGKSRGGDRVFDGLLDDLRIFTGVLTTGEIQEIRIGTGDSDSDGHSNAEEESAGTCWGDAGDFLRPAAVTSHTGDGSFRVDLDGKTDRSYRLLRIQGGGLDGALEEVGATPALGENAPVALSDPAPPPGRAFYQVAAEKGMPVRPNILLIIADDHGYADLGAYAHARPDIKNLTPRLDSLAAGGVLFTQAYAVGPVCSPARSGMITGRYPHEWDSTGGWSPGLPVNVPTIAEYLRDTGYQTAMLGKSDYGKGFFTTTTREHPLRHGFDSFFGFSAHAHDYYLHSQDIANRAIGTNDSAHLGPLISNNGRLPLPDGKWLTEELTDRAISFIGGQKSSIKPFFLELSYNSVHSLIHQVPQAYLDAEGIPRLPDYDPSGDFASYGSYYNAYSRPGYRISDADMRKYYRAHLRAFDDQIGRVLDELAASGLASNTLVVYLSDNGGEAFTGANNLPLSGCKYTTFEGGIRVPFIMNWPGKLPAGITYPHVVSALDVSPTLCEAAGIREVPNLRGHSLLKPVRGQTPVVAGGRNLFWKFNSFWAVRHDDWKLVFSNKGDATGHTSQVRFNAAALGKICLFNLANDPGETNDLAGDPEFAGVKADLQSLYNSWFSSL